MAYGLTAALLITAAALQQEMAATLTDIAIKGPTEVQVAERLVLRADKPGEWDLGSLDPDQYIVLEEGAVVCIWTRQSQRIRVLHIYATVDEGGKVSLWKSVHIVLVKGAGPGPTPDPPKPDPPKPDPLTGLAKQVRDMCASHNVDKQQADKLATNYIKVATGMASGEISRDDATITTRDLNREVLGDAAQTWRPWFEDLAGMLTERRNQGQLETTNHFQLVWTQIAGGLKAYASAD